MACFAAPLAEAIVTTVSTKIIKNKKGDAADIVGKLKILNKMLWGGSALLAFEHVWHGEVVPFFPFLTAASNPESAAEMLREISTTGITMAILVTAVWGVICGVSALIKKRNSSSPTIAASV